MNFLKTFAPISSRFAKVFQVNFSNLAVLRTNNISNNLWQVLLRSNSLYFLEKYSLNLAQCFWIFVASSLNYFGKVVRAVWGKLADHYRLSSSNFFKASSSFKASSFFHQVQRPCSDKFTKIHQAYSSSFCRELCWISSGKLFELLFRKVPQTLLSFFKKLSFKNFFFRKMIVLKILHTFQASSPKFLRQALSFWHFFRRVPLEFFIEVLWSSLDKFSEFSQAGSPHFWDNYSKLLRDFLRKLHELFYERSPSFPYSPNLFRQVLRIVSSNIIGHVFRTRPNYYELVRCISSDMFSEPVQASYSRLKDFPVLRFLG